MIERGSGSPADARRSGPGASQPTLGGAREARRLTHDLKILATFIKTYCAGRHRELEKQPVVIKTHDVASIYGGPLRLCADCRKLLVHAYVMRTRCLYDPKPACKHCPTHCYAPSYRAQIRAVMRYAGRRVLLSGRLDYLVKLLF